MSKFFQRRDLDKTFLKVLVSMLMVFVLLISVASPSHAVVGVTSILIPSVIAALESWGISTAADGLDGDEIAEWFHEKLTSWETAAQISLANIVTGIKMTPIGQVLLNPIALAGIREFGVWLIQQEGLVAGGGPVEVLSGGTFFNGYQVWKSVTIVSGSISYVFDCSDTSFLFVTSPAAKTYNVNVVSTVYNDSVSYVMQIGSSTYPSTFHLTNHYGNGYYYVNSIPNVPSVDFEVVSYDYQTVLSGTGGVTSASGSLSLDASSSMNVPTVNDIQDKEMLINTSLDVGGDAAAWYEQVMNKVAANDMTATGTLVGAGTITADQVIDQGAITEQEGVVSWPDVTVPIGVSGLDEIFPFCIPFDIYHFFEALAADPVAPSFEIPFVIEGVVDYTFEIDLEPFDQVAQILRLVELLAFCVGLAFVTRSMFIRG